MSAEIVPKIVWVAVGGAFGAVARYLVAEWAMRAIDQPYPWGTTIANLLGSLSFGLLWTLAEQRTGFSTQWRLLLMTGFLGAFTTFSTFMFETVKLMDAQRPLAALLNLGTQNALGIVCVYLGILGGKGVNLMR